MSKIYTSAHQLIGSTPLLQLCGIEKEIKFIGKSFTLVRKSASIMMNEILKEEKVAFQ